MKQLILVYVCFINIIIIFIFNYATSRKAERHTLCARLCTELCILLHVCNCLLLFGMRRVVIPLGVVLTCSSMRVDAILVPAQNTDIILSRTGCLRQQLRMELLQ